MYAILFMMLMANWLFQKVALGTLCPSTVLFYSYSLVSVEKAKYTISLYWDGEAAV